MAVVNLESWDGYEIRDALKRSGLGEIAHWNVTNVTSTGFNHPSIGYLVDGYKAGQGANFRLYIIDRLLILASGQ